MPSYNPYRKVIDMLMPKIQNGVLYLDELEETMVDVGILPNDYKKYDGIPKRLVGAIERDHDETFKKAYDSWKRHLAHYELVCIGERASRFKTRIALSFEPLKENTQEKQRDAGEKYLKAFQRRAKVISSTTTFNEEDAKELDEWHKHAKIVQEKSKLLKLKYDKKRIQ